MSGEGRALSCRYCGHDTANADGVCGPCATVEGRVQSRRERWFYESEWPFILPWALFAVAVVVICVVFS